ncbi:MAG TPA: hypothetical protein V6D06_11275, partial [Trichocoleus sp.]
IPGCTCFTIHHALSRPMYPRRPQRKIFPKISTLPRQRSEASHYLDMYKLTVEKNRLQSELHSLDEQRQRIQQRLDEIATHTDELEGGAQHLRGLDNSSQPATPTSNIYLPSSRPSASTSDEFNMLFLEY